MQGRGQRRIGDDTIGRRVLQNPQHGPAREIGARPVRKTFKTRQDAQSLAITLEPAVIAHAVIERDFAAMTERRMPEIMRAADRMDRAAIGEQRSGGVVRTGCLELPRDAACDLGNFERVGEAGAIEVAIAKV